MSFASHTPEPAADLHSSECGNDATTVLPASSSPQVRMVGGLHVMFAPGGGERQLTETTVALQSLGVKAAAWRPWEESLAGIDILHFFGTLSEHLPLLAAAKRAGIRTVVSTIAWYDLYSVWNEPRSYARRLLGCGRQLLRQACPRLPSWRRELYSLADLLLPNSQAEADQLTRYFGVDRRKLQVIPNGADTRLATASPVPFRELVGTEPFVLCAGRIEPRKNQLGLVRAMQYAQFPRVVFLGDPVPEHEAYYHECVKQAAGRATFIPRLPADSLLLASAYAACSCLVMPSYFETPGLVAIEAGMSGIPLVVTSRGATREYFGNEAYYVVPHDHRGLANAVAYAAMLPRNRRLAEQCQQKFSWQMTALRTREAYAHLV